VHGWIDAGAEDDMVFLQEIVVEVRRFRHEHGITPSTRTDAVVNVHGRFAELVSGHAEELKALAGLGSLEVGSQPSGWSRIVAGQAEVYLPLGELIDLGAERTRLERAIQEASKLAERAQAKLDNTGFTDGAPAQVVDKVRAQLSEHNDRLTKLRAQLEELGA
jgi:valyl-tRNA synthetase